MGSLTGRHIVVTGASAGIGAELCRQLAPHKVKLTLAARSMDRLAAVAAGVSGSGSEVLVQRCDVSQRQEVEALVAAARARFGEIDIWVSNAGRGTRHRVLEASDEDMLELYRLNCLSSLYAYQALIPQWLERGDGGRGRQIIDICSLAGKAGYAWNSGYAAAKHGMSAVADALRLELNGSGIIISTIYPGRTVSGFSAAVEDRTGGDESTHTRHIEKGGSWLSRQIASAQSTETVARVIVGAMQRPRPRVFPHRWGNLAVLIYNLWPGLALKLANKPLAPKK
jgi:short-subunit dehydrogenase